MHEIARHLIHSTEIMEAMIDSFTSIQTAHEELFAELGFETEVSRAAYKQTKRSLAYQLQLFKGLRLRSIAFEKRLTNKINLVR